MRGQLDALERAPEAEADCGRILQQRSAVSGAANGLVSEVPESHPRVEFGQTTRLPEQRKASVDAAVALGRS